MQILGYKPQPSFVGLQSRGFSPLNPSRHMGPSWVHPASPSPSLGSVLWQSGAGKAVRAWPRYFTELIERPSKAAKNSRCPGWRRGCRWERGASVTCKHLLMWKELQHWKTSFHVFNNSSRVQTFAFEDTFVSDCSHSPAGQSWVTAN